MIVSDRTDFKIKEPEKNGKWSIYEKDWQYCYKIKYINYFLKINKLSWYN